MRVLTWNGRRLPPELRKLPPGKYAVARLDQVPPLTEEEEAGLEAALASFRRDGGIPAEQVFAEMRAHLRKRAVSRKRGR